MGLCVKKNKSQYMGVLGYPAARGIVRDARAEWRGLRKGKLIKFYCIETEVGKSAESR